MVLNLQKEWENHRTANVGTARSLVPLSPNPKLCSLAAAHAPNPDIPISVAPVQGAAIRAPVQCSAVGDLHNKHNNDIHKKEVRNLHSLVKKGHS